MTTTIFLASDHGGFDLKEFLIKELASDELDIIDLGPSNTDSVDYPDYAHKLCYKVVENTNSLGILICGTGIGMSIAANRHSKIRAALCSESYSAGMAKEHNNANVLCLGARVTGPALALQITNTFLSIEFGGERHQRRIEKFTP